MPDTKPAPARLLALGASVSLLGVAFSASRGEESGRYISVIGVLILIFALHGFGRTGPDAATRRKRRRAAEPASTAEDGG